MMETTALLVTALLFGGMVLYAFGFAAFMLNALPADIARPTIRLAFPHFYLFVIGAASLGAVLLAIQDALAAAIMAAIALTTAPTRQILMPAINAATDAGLKRRFRVLHGLSVLITLVHILATGLVLSRFV
ncbi:MAG: DUF4149 domain-containing protein [Pseudomonadota bacterium]